ncbi:opsin 8, group member b [Aplochiton taeniatus]
MDHFSSKLAPSVDIVAGVFLLIIAVLSIVGNLLVLIMAFKRSSGMKPPELLSVNLAVTDLGAAVSMYPLAMASAWNHHWIGGHATCVYYALVGFFFGVASLMNLTVMAIVRFMVSLSLQSPKEKISRRTVKILCLWIWIYALVWALFPVMGWGRYGPEPFGLSCSLAWGEMKEEDFSFVFSLFTLNLAIPSVVISGCYFGIALKLYVTYKSMNNGNQIPNIIKMHRRLLLIAVLISAGFIVCWAPYGIVSLWSVFCSSKSIPPVVALLPCMFAKSSTVYNPFIYYGFSNTFRKEAKRLGRLCRRSNACHASEGQVTDNGNGIYMICDDPKETHADDIGGAFERTKEMETQLHSTGS